MPISQSIRRLINSAQTRNLIPITIHAYYKGKNTHQLIHKEIKGHLREFSKYVVKTRYCHLCIHKFTLLTEKIHHPLDGIILTKVHQINKEAQNIAQNWPTNEFLSPIYRVPTGKAAHAYLQKYYPK